MRTYSLTTETAKEEEFHDLTYAMKEKHISGYVNDIESVKQAVYKMLNTERFEYPVYSFSFGAELNRLIGKEQPYIRAEVKRIVTEALLTDNRVKSVSDFIFSFSGDCCNVQFSVSSIYGNFNSSVEVNV